MTEGVPRQRCPFSHLWVVRHENPGVGALELGAKAISGLRRDASADARPGPRAEQSAAAHRAVDAAQ